MAEGDLALTITIAAVDAASNIIDQITQGITSLAGDGVLGAVAAGAVAAATAVATIGVAAVKAAGDFQQSMETLVTSAGESQDKIAGLSQDILKMSVDTGTSTQQLTQGMYYVESAGYHAADAIKVMTAAAEGAKAENADLDTVSKALTTTMTDYHMGADQATQAMNGLIAIVQNGKTNLEELASSMGAVLPIASSMGISFSQVGGAMAELTNAGIPAKQAAQNLAHVFVALQSPSAIATKSMTEVGLSAQQVKNALVSQGLPEAFQLIEDHVGKKFPEGSVAYQTALKNILGGMVGLKTAAALSGASLQTTEDDIKKVAAALDQGGNSVMGWDVVQGEFNFQLDRAQQAINALMIELGEKLLPILSPIVAAFANMVETVSTWISGIQSAGATGNIFINILTALGISTNTAELIVADFSLSLHLLGEIFANVGNVLTIIFGGAIHLVGNILVALANGPIQDIIKSFNEVLVFIEDFTSWLSDTFTNIGIAAQTWGQNLGINFANGFASVIGEIIDAVMSVITTIEDYLGFASPTRKGPGSQSDRWGPALVRTLANGMTASVSYLDDASNLVAQRMGSPIKAEKPITPSGTASPIVSGLQKQLDTVCNQSAPATSKCVSDTLTNGLANAIKSNASALKPATNAVAQHLNAIPLHATKAATATKKALAAAVPDVAPTKAAVDSIGQMLDQIPKKAQDVADKAKNAIKGIFVPPEGARQIAAWFENTWTAIVNFLKPGFTYIVSTIQTQIVPAFRLFLGAIQALGSNIKDFIQYVGPILIGAILSAIQAMGKWIIESGVLKTIWDAIVLGVKTFIQAATVVVNWIDNIVVAVMRWVTSGQAAKALAPIFQAMATTIQSQLSILKQSIENMISTFQTVWKTVQAQLIPALVNLGTTLKPVAMFIIGLGIAVIQANAAFTKWVATSGVIKAMWTGVGDAMKLFISIVSQIINAISSALQPVLKQLGDTFNTQLKPAFEHLIAAIIPLLPFLEDVAKFIGGVLLINIGVLVALITGIIKAIGGLLTGIIQAIGGVVQFISGFIQFFIGMWSFFMDLITGKWSKMGQDLGTAWQGFLDMFYGLANIFYGIWSAMINGVIGLVSGFVQGIIDFFTNLYNDLVGHSIIPDTVNGIMDWWKKIPDFLTNLLSGLVTTLSNTWDKIKITTTTAWGNITKGMTDALTKAGDWTKSWATGLAQDFKTWGSNMLTMFGQGISSAWTGVQTAITNAAQWVKNTLGFSSPPKQGPLADSDKYMPNMVTMFASGINANAYKVTDATNNMASGVVTSMGNMDLAVNQHINNITNNVNNAKTSIDNNLNTISVTSQNTSQSIGQDFVNIGTQATNAATQVQGSSQTMQTASAGAAQGAQAAMWVVTNANTNIVSSTSQAAASHSTLKNTFTQNSQAMVQAAQGSSVQVSSAYQEMENQSKLAVSSFAFARTQFQWALDDIQNGAWQGAVHQFQAGVSSAISGVIADAQSAAAQVAALLGHSKPKTGPLRDDDQWGKHFVENIVSGIEGGMPGLQNAAKGVASTLAGVLPSNTIKISADSSLIGSLTDASNKPMVIYQVLDGKVISKTVTNYQARELRVQGVVRGI